MVTRVIKLRIMKGVDHVTLMGDTKVAYKILVGKPEGKRPLKRCKRTWGIILEWILKEQVGKV
jgi:hypothetical protein